MDSSGASDKPVEEALSLIRSTQLSVSEHKVLSFFVEDAVDPNYAAKYLLKWVSDNSKHRGTEHCLRQFKNDWRQLSDRLKSDVNPIYSSPLSSSASRQSQCCITGKTRPWWDVFHLYGVSAVCIIPPTFLEGPEISPGSRLHELLGAFITPAQRDRLAFVNNSNIERPADSQGGENYRAWNDKILENRLFLEPDTRKAFRNGRIQIVPYLEQDWNSTPIVQTKSVKQTVCQLLMVFPVPYPTLTDQSGRILRTMENLTFTTSDPDDDPLPSSFLLSVHFRFCNSMRWFQIEDELAADLRSCVAEFRRVPNNNDGGYVICNPLGGPVFDYRLHGDSAGPFHSEQEFNQALVLRDDLKDAVAPSHSRSHKIYFTHADLSAQNILISEGKLSGVVDFGCSGFYPEYWEYTKCMYDFWSGQEAWADLISQTFGASYDEELKVERTLWQYTSPW
ncbi:hypothetical protein FQN54_006460 [Arachnomyces sp. PD_36]|nr:hypothetical protein FQN54_006460 [Arachnomyces sp. PD_36]